MTDAHTPEPDGTAVRVALWRALHVRVDAPPHVLDDELGLRLAAPDDDRLRLPDMDPDGTRHYRGGVLARARYIEDLVLEQLGHGVDQYVILGAGLDTFAQRRPEVAARLRVFEVDRPGPQAWKRRRLVDLGLGVPDGLHLVPVDFEANESWWAQLTATGFDPGRPAVVASAGVSMYLTHEANEATLRQIASLAPGSTLAMTFQPPLELLDEEERPGRLAVEKGARASGTPFLSFYAPDTILALADRAGFARTRHVSAAMLNARYFADRTDGLRTSNGEEFLIAGT
ncbi:class I SAM-dependent methyltransferase [Embleya sp. AB8]|uniref:class I SAM-dependent methyltransferase n=1 Tax=Embleya sp. AB8 TaxID=3156304 RepID=UPI003C74668A